MTSERDAMMREVTELSENSRGELSAPGSGRREENIFFYGLKNGNTRQSVKELVPRTEIAKTYENQRRKKTNEQSENQNQVKSI